MLDEPSFGLAPRLVEAMFKIIDTVRREEKVSVLLVEQNAAQALELADHAYLIETGALVASATPRNSPMTRKSAARIWAIEARQR